MKIAFILNPTAQGGRCAEVAERIRRWPFPDGVEWSLHLTQAPGDGQRLTEELADQQDVCCAVGGDGTLHEVAKVLFKKKQTKLGVIPAGTGNDMVKSLGWSRQFEPSMQRLFNGVTRCLDAGLADGHFFLNIASIGFDAQVLVEIASLHKKKWAKLSYLYGLLVALKTYEDLPVRFAEAPSAEHSLFLFAAGNGAYYGGGFQILPQADPTDGVLDFCAVCDIPRRTLLRLLPSVVRATHVRHTEYVQMSRAPKRSVEVLAPFYLNLDGELRTYSQGARVEFSVCPQSLVLLGGSGEQK